MGGFFCRLFEENATIAALIFHDNEHQSGKQKDNFYEEAQHFISLKACNPYNEKPAGLSLRPAGQQFMKKIRRRLN